MADHDVDDAGTLGVFTIIVLDYLLILSEFLLEEQLSKQVRFKAHLPGLGLVLGFGLALGFS